MNILFITSSNIVQNRGGVGRVTETLSKEFLKLGLEVTYLSLSKGEDIIDEVINRYHLPNGKNYIDFKNITYFKELIITKKINIIINQLGFSVPELKFIKANCPSTTKLLTVHHNCLKCLNDQYHNIYQKTLKLKGIYNIFNNKLGWYILKKIHKYRLGRDIRESIKLSDKIVLLSKKFIPEVSFYLSNFDKNKVVGISNPNPFKKVNVKIENKEKRIVFVGRLSIVQKRIERLIEIWEDVSLSYHDWYFDIIGDGGDRELIENMAREKGLNRINFHGFRDPKPFLEKAKILIMTSDFEGFGMVLVEAQTYGVVPIAFNCFSAIDDIILTNETGIIIDDFKIDIYIEKIKELIQNEKLLDNMAHNSIKSVGKFESSNVANKWMELFHSL